MEHLVYPSKALSEQAFEKNEVLFETWHVKAEYAWDTGVAMSKYLAELKQGKLIGRRCFKCKRLMVPPRMFCEQCFRPTDAWEYVQDTGTVKTFSLCYIRFDMARLKEPEIPAVIDIDGASPGMGILHKLGEVDPQAVKIGMKVQAVWKPEAEREGSTTDIAYFKPVQ